MARLRWVTGATAAALPATVAACSNPPTSTPQPSSTPSLSVSPSTTAAPVAVHYQSEGSGSRVLVLVHGRPGAGEPALLTAFAPLTEHGFTVYYDQRGVGSSPAPADGDYSPDAYIADLDALRRSLGVQRIDVLGHSWGGYVVALYAAAHPENVGTAVEIAGLPLDDAAAQPGFQNFQSRLSALQAQHLVPLPLPEPVGDNCAGVLAALGPVYAADPNHPRSPISAGAVPACSVNVGNQTDAAISREAARVTELATALRHWKGHAIIAMGEHDPFGEAWLKADSAQYASANLTQLPIPGAGHFPWLDDPSFVATLAQALGA